MAFDWIVITTDDINAYLAAAAVTAFQTKALATDQEEPFLEAMHSVTDLVRSKIAAHYVLSDTDYSVPPSLKQITCLLVVEQLQGRLPDVRLTENQQKMVDSGREDLKLIEEGKFAIEYPTDPATDSGFQIAGNAVEVVTHTCKLATRCTLAGL